MDINEKEKQVDQLIKDNQIQRAVQDLYELVVACVAEKNFSKADFFREKLIQIDSMAIQEIVKSGELIEKAKSDAIDKNHLELWSALYDLMTSEESNLLFFATRESSFEPSKLVLEQGKTNQNLFLVDEGRLQMFYRMSNRVVMIRKLEPGSFFGDDSFFSIQAFSSVSVMTETKTKMRCLPKEIFRQWDKNTPGLSSKLLDYVQEAGMTHDHVNAMKLKRRLQKRIPVTGNGRFQFYDHSGKLMGNPVKGTLLDISQGGMSFAIRVTKRETARMILGRKLIAQFNAFAEKGPVLMERVGIIVSVHEYSLEDYALHMRFDQVIDSALIENYEKRAGTRIDPSNGPVGNMEIPGPDI